MFRNEKTWPWIVAQLTERKETCKRNMEAFRRLDMPYEREVAEMRAFCYAEAVRTIPEFVETTSNEDRITFRVEHWIRGRLRLWAASSCVFERASDSIPLIGDILEEGLTRDAAFDVETQEPV